MSIDNVLLCLCLFFKYSVLNKVQGHTVPAAALPSVPLCWFRVLRHQGYKLHYVTLVEAQSLPHYPINIKPILPSHNFHL